VRSRIKCNIQQKWDNYSHIALCSQVFSEDFLSNIYSQHISLLSRMFFLLSWMLHVIYYEWNITYSTRKLKCTTLYNEINPLYYFCLNIPPQHCFYYPVTSYVASEWQKQKFWTLAMCIFYEQFFDLPQWRVLYSNLQAQISLHNTL